MSIVLALLITGCLFLYYKNSQLKNKNQLLQEEVSYLNSIESKGIIYNEFDVSWKPYLENVTIMDGVYIVWITTKYPARQIDYLKNGVWQNNIDEDISHYARIPTLDENKCLKQIK
jgi:hypothetical protein